MNKDFYIEKMKQTYQFDNCDMLQHGQMVLDHFNEIINNPNKLPKEIIELLFLLKNKIYSKDITDEYHLYHDIGKPISKTISSDGKVHYYNHAKVSYEIYKQLHPEKEIICEVILHDMDFHTLPSEELKKLWEQPYAPTLYFTAWAEIYANSIFFGGIDSISFKIKRKKLIQTGKYYLNKIKSSQENPKCKTD